MKHPKCPFLNSLLNVIHILRSPENWFLKLSGHLCLVPENEEPDEFESDAENGQELKKVKMWKAFQETTNILIMVSPIVIFTLHTT